jgi:hypothetical protein
MHLDGGGHRPALSDAADSRSPTGKSRLCLGAIPPGCVVLGFSAHAVHPSRPGRVTPQLPGGDLAGPLSPAFLPTLCEHIGRQAPSADRTCVVAAMPGSPATGSGLGHPGAPGELTEIVALSRGMRADIG